MKTIKLNTIITSIRAKVDRSLGLTLATPELNSIEKAEIMNLQGIYLDTYFKPLDVQIIDILEINKDLNNKSQAQRIRSVLFLLWKKDGEEGDFNDFYKLKTEKYINYLKSKLEE